MTAKDTVLFVVACISAIGSLGGMAYVIRGYNALASTVSEIKDALHEMDKRLYRIEIEHGHNHRDGGGNGVPVAGGNGVPVAVPTSFNSGPVGTR